MGIPDILFKYTSLETTKVILKNCTLRWSNPYVFNDILEFQRMPVFSPAVEERYHDYIDLLVGNIYDEKELDVKKLSSLSQQLLMAISLNRKHGVTKENLINDLKTIDCPLKQQDVSSTLREGVGLWGNQYARILCFTSEVDNEMMWGLYADNHHGCVLGFKSDYNIMSPFSEAEPVRYTENNPTIGDGIDFLLYGETPKLRTKTFKAVCYTKSNRWSYENEWRLITWRHEESGESGDYKFYNEELESITFGNRMSEDARNEIKELVLNKYKSCTFYEIVVFDGVLSRQRVLG